MNDNETTLGTGVVLLDSSGRIQGANEQAAFLLGSSLSELRGSEFKQWIRSGSGNIETFATEIEFGGGVAQVVLLRASVLQETRQLVLLVDDDTDLRESTRGFLQDHGFRVLTANDGQEALQLFRSARESISLVICDASMPKMSGGELYLVMRTLNPAIKFLMISGHSSKDVRDAGSLGPEVPVIEKPWSGSELLSEVRKLLASPPSAR